ncbi:cysteine hydrolase family protein [Microbispora sp. CA-102843]|uniref:cysteine hydrolase family protein n=1 Tax=Microbispora sp. CA-102843 TaxID=3239952 RepID=UPI003D8DC838
MSEHEDRWVADALLVIDMQNSFLHPKGALYRAKGAPLIEIEATVNANRRAIEAAKAAGVPVIFTRQCYRPDYVDAGRQSPKNYPLASDDALIEGSWDYAIVDELPVDNALFVDKPRMDAFYNTSLEVLLRGLSVSRLAIGGVVTNACVETTTRSAAMRDFDVTVLADCCTTASAADQAASFAGLTDYGLARVRDFGLDLFPAP